MFCGKCGAQIKEGVKFCNQCGASISEGYTGEGHKPSIVCVIIGAAFIVLGIIDMTLKFIGVDITGLGCSTIMLVGAGMLIFAVAIYLFYSAETEADADVSTGSGSVDAQSVRSAAERLQPDNKFIIRFDSSAGPKSIIGCKLAKEEKPIVLFGRNSRLGVLSATGWCGMAFTSKGVHYKLVEVYQKTILKVLGEFGLRTVAKGFVAYEDVRQLSVEAVSVYCNKRILGKFVAAKAGERDADGFDADSEAAIALKEFCRQIVKST